jgi:hypothetical protein
LPEPETRLLINGEQVAGEGAPLEVENPATEETVDNDAGPVRRLQTVRPRA